LTGPLVVAIVLSHERPDRTVACLRSLRSSLYPNLEVVVLDTGQAPGSADDIGRAFPGTEIVALEGNRGYAGGNNTGLALALRRRADWALLVNDDVTVAADCLSRLVECGESERRIGMVGPTVHHRDEPRVIQSAGGYLEPDWSASFLAADEPDRGQLREPRDVAWLSGCALLVRLELYEQIGPLDERFFCYWEDVDWCLRAHRYGWRVVHEPAARAWHEGGRTGSAPHPAVAYYTTRNHLLALGKHGAPLRVRLVAARRLGTTLLVWSVRPSLRSRRAARTAMWQGVADFALGRFGERPSTGRGRSE